MRGDHRNGCCAIVHTNSKINALSLIRTKISIVFVPIHEFGSSFIVLYGSLPWRAIAISIHQKQTFLLLKSLMPAALINISFLRGFLIQFFAFSVPRNKFSKRVHVNFGAIDCQ